MPYGVAKLFIQNPAAISHAAPRSPVSTSASPAQVRSHFADACASLRIGGELIHLENVVLHDDAGHDIRTPTDELTIGRDALRTRRRIAAQPPGWALSPTSAACAARRGKWSEDFPARRPRQNWRN